MRRFLTYLGAGAILLALAFLSGEGSSPLDVPVAAGALALGFLVSREAKREDFDV